MINLKRLNNDIVYVNPDLIKFIEEKPDTTITFTNGEKLIVRESPQDIIQKIIWFKNISITRNNIKDQEL